METTVKACVLTAHNGKGWYPRGQRRLIDSLRHHGFRHDIVALELLPTKSGGWGIMGRVNGNVITPIEINQYKSDCVYTLKAAAFDYAISLGYDTILWLDCSVFPVADIEPVFDVIAQDGYYFWRSGWNLGQTCSDACLAYHWITRYDAFDVDDCSTSMFGVKLSNPDAKQFIDSWLKAAADGMFHGSRAEIPGAKDNEQKFEHRQDQSVATCMINNLGLKMHNPGVYSQIANRSGDYPNSVVLVMRGM